MNAKLMKKMKMKAKIEDSFYQTRPECDDVPNTRFRPKAGKTLSERRWRSAFSEEGYLDIAKVLNRVERGGVHPSIRGEVWEFLLGCFDPKSSFAERNSLRKWRREQYAKLKADCQAIDSSVGSGVVITAPRINQDGSPVQNSEGLNAGNNNHVPYTWTDSHFSLKEDNPYQSEMQSVGQAGRKHSLGSNQNDSWSGMHMDKDTIQWILLLHQIGLDVVRTDRTLKFYENSENLAKLWDILAVYAWMDKDIGYCQGMSDLCSPMVVLHANEADAFWCFEHLMRRIRGNFKCTENSVGVQTQLQNLASITQVLEPKLHKHLETLGGGSYIFAFRMLMVLFRREFSFGDALFLWEMMWALEYDPEIIASYQETSSSYPNKSGRVKRTEKSKEQRGKYERQRIENGFQGSLDTPIAVFLVASVLKAKSSKLLREAQGIDDVVKILNDLTGNMDAKKACTGALTLHKKYLRK
ncbi:hypothetical protein KI387_005871, partial [Taxus chinensis]